MVEAGEDIQRNLPEVNKVQRQIIVICGPEGSGKTTQAEFLEKDLNLPRISMGDVFRELAKQDTDLGRKSKEVIEKHGYSDKNLFEAAFLLRMQNDDVANGFIFDGGFRTMQQVNKFEALLREVDISEDIPISVVYYRMPGWVAAERLLERRRDDDSIAGALSRLSNHYNRLGERMSEAGRKWPFIIINAFGKSAEELNRETKEQVGSKAQARI